MNNAHCFADGEKPPRMGVVAQFPEKADVIKVCVTTTANVVLRRRRPLSFAFPEPPVFQATPLNIAPTCYSFVMTQETGLIICFFV